MKFNNGAQAMPRTERRILMKLVPLKHFYFLWREEIASDESIVIKFFLDFHHFSRISTK
jgi:hypothetical protein